jgi:hydroxymethylbilane synthase
MILKPDGSEAHETARAADAADAARAGADAGLELKARAGPGFLAGH